MTNRTHDDDSELNAGPVGLRDAVDRWGPELSDWPDISLVRLGREALLSDRAFRAYRDGAVTTDECLEAASAALDERIASGGSAERIARKVMARVAPPPQHWRRRAAAVAAVLVAAGLLGSASEWVSLDRSEARSNMVVVQLDPLVFGPDGVGF